MTGNPFADWTLGDAMPVVRHGMRPCACSGPWPVCWCAQAVNHAHNLHRAAHIVGKQLAALSERLAEEDR